VGDGERGNTRVGLAFFIALAVMIANDHVLKGSGLVPGWLTGKLSDLAGLVVAPVVLAVLCRARTPRARALALAAVAVAFAAIKVSRSAADALEALMLAVGLRWRLWSDPTDLLALAVLPFTLRLLSPVRSERGNRPARDFWRRLGVIAGALACAATSSTVRPGPARRIVNATHDKVVVAVYEPTDPLDCVALETNPESAVDLPFAFAECLSLPPYESSLPLGSLSGPDCGATAIVRPGLDSIVVVWFGAPPYSVPERGAENDTEDAELYRGYLLRFGERFYLDPSPTMSTFVLPSLLPDADGHCVW
jgi:hypothetical protein